MISYHGGPGYGQERAGLEANGTYQDSSILAGYRDGTDFFMSYSKQLRNGTVLPRITRGQAALHKVKTEVDVLAQLKPSLKHQIPSATEPAGGPLQKDRAKMSMRHHLP